MKELLEEASPSLLGMQYKNSNLRGPVNLRDLQCLVLEGRRDVFLLGDPTLKSLGIDVDHLLEQLASNNEQFQEDDDVPEDDFHVKQAQERFRRHAPDGTATLQDVVFNVEGKTWIHHQAKALLVRILIFLTVV
ncbi:hypothetical protein PsorP6_015073 [Peronosclerospora sorghi]|uniref:Uncharacterized protein n=1 Tax=Peronosclerospora sorghi TaxID=230839 RepID=A0ACC0VTW3_9STRA|nr:hypothetical protein PsorP6_015073 [Peronosclerospora sorghi]